MKNDDKELYELISNLSKGVRRHGLKKVIRAIKQINITDKDDYKFSIIEFIEDSVCTKIGVPKDEIFAFNSRGEITIARKLCILLIRKYIENISDEELGNHFNRSRQVIHNTEKEFRQLQIGKHNKFHIDFLAIYNDLDVQADNFINILKNK
jgi:hypothetical protein